MTMDVDFAQIVNGLPNADNSLVVKTDANIPVGTTVALDGRQICVVVTPANVPVGALVAWGVDTLYVVLASEPHGLYYQLTCEPIPDDVRRTIGL